MKHAWSVLCADYVFDEHAGLMDIKGIIDDAILLVPSDVVLPDASGGSTVSANFKLVSCWFRDGVDVPEGGRCRLTLVTPRDPQPTVAAEIAVGLTAAKRATTTVNITAYLWRGTGRYIFKVEAETQISDQWQTVAEVPFQVRVEVQPKAVTRPSVPTSTKRPKGFKGTDKKKPVRKTVTTRRKK